MSLYNFMHADGTVSPVFIDSNKVFTMDEIEKLNVANSLDKLNDNFIKSTMKNRNKRFSTAANLVQKMPRNLRKLFWKNAKKHSLLNYSRQVIKKQHFRAVEDLLICHITFGFSNEGAKFWFKVYDCYRANIRLNEPNVRFLLLNLTKPKNEAEQLIKASREMKTLSKNLKEATQNVSLLTDILTKIN